MRAIKTSKGDGGFGRLKKKLGEKPSGLMDIMSLKRRKVLGDVTLVGIPLGLVVVERRWTGIKMPYRGDGEQDLDREVIRTQTLDGAPLTFGRKWGGSQ